MTNLTLQFFLLIVIFYFHYSTAFLTETNEKEEIKPKTWVLLVAGSNDWYNYRHQADICHAYQIVKNHGIPDENIIVMMYDDIANNSQNPHKGVIINHPKGPDVYKGVPKDYIGQDVNSSNFLKILLGDSNAMRGIGSGKVIKSNKNDRIFVNFVDHGGSGVLCFPDDELTAGQLIKTLKQMHKDKKYNEMVMYIEACESGSIFKDILPSNMNIFVTTAADYDEPSMACYLDDKLDTYLGDCYSVNWMEDTDRTDIRKETLLQQFIRVKEETNTSHVKQYGTTSWENLPVGDFQGESTTQFFAYPKVEKSPVSSHDVPLALLKRKLAQNHRNSKALYQEYKNIKKIRLYFEKSIKSILRSISNGSEQLEKWFDQKPQSIDNLDCHTKIVQLFSKKCLKFGKNPYALKFVYTLTNVCNDGNVNFERLNVAFKKYCKSSQFGDGVM